MSETEVKKEVEAVEEQKSVVNKDAVAAEPTHLKNGKRQICGQRLQPKY